LTCLFVAACISASADAPQVDLAAARASDPVVLGWMQGSPPPSDKVIRFEDGSFYRFPQHRWAMSHWRELRPTVAVSRGDAPVQPLKTKLRRDLDAVTFIPTGGGAPMTFADSLVANYTDGIVVLHRGRIVYERYLGALKEDREHICFSVTKSFFGTLAAVLVHEGSLNRTARVADYLPELARSGFGDATVAQVLDMTTALNHDESYTGEAPASMVRYRNATHFLPRKPGFDGETSIYRFLPTIQKSGQHGAEFHYRTPNVDVAAWLIARVTGKSPAAALSERIWSRLGAEADAYLQVDDDGTPLVGGSLNARLRDVARFGEMMRNEGRVAGRQVISPEVVHDIAGGGSREAFKYSGYTKLPGWSYHHFWWVPHDDHGVFMARGIHGQVIYIDPKAEMVIARFASHPMAANAHMDPTSLPAYRAIAARLRRG
jgi:CubicO group peptidase (beta-lactamase class C family)